MKLKWNRIKEKQISNNGNEPSRMYSSFKELLMLSQHWHWQIATFQSKNKWSGLDAHRQVKWVKGFKKAPKKYFKNTIKHQKGVPQDMFYIMDPLPNIFLEKTFWFPGFTTKENFQKCKTPRKSLTLYFYNMDPHKIFFFGKTLWPSPGFSTRVHLGIELRYKHCCEPKGEISKVTYHLRVKSD